MRHVFFTLCAAFATVTSAQAPQSDVISCLEIYDMQTKTHRIIKEFNYRIEAPNWTPDGKWLVFNSNGKLWKISPDKPYDPIEINTGDAVNCNNDHVVSSDGNYMAISASLKGMQGYTSYVFTIPFEGGTSKMITPVGPSYLHGWSNDMKKVAYCAFRDMEKGADIYVKPVDGGPEVQLTDAPGLDDGPEYSPDDKSIWFNSVRTGLMQVWRMKADGSEQTQMTFDEDLNSWFPHISPDGKTVVYICYHKGDLEPGQHVANKNVLLRMIPAEGGQPETLVELFGGQGTINVNSWSPDSQKFAYVSYRLKNK